MSIAKTDIKLMASERLTDYEDGGGQMTGNEVTDGTVNNLFPDISRLDRVYGRVSLRKAFVGVMTANRDMYYGAHAILSDPPEDDNVHVTLFSTNDFYDVRADAKNRIESFVNIAQETALRLMNDQLRGQRAITCFCRPGTVIPKISETIVLKDTVSGNQQYVRIQDMSRVTETFVIENYGTFTADVVTIDLSAALLYDFPGMAVTPYTTKGVTRIHATVVADAASYYGVSRLTEPATAGSMTLKVDSIYNQLVPTSQIETAFVDQLLAGDNQTMIRCGAANSLTWSGARSNASNVIRLRSGILPGSLTLTVDGLTFRDEGGDLAAVSSAGGYSGTVSYAEGSVTLLNSSAWSQTVSITATPAVTMAEHCETSEILIELANRAWNYTPNLQPLPRPGSVIVDYMAQGVWYRLKDNGRGELVPEEEDTGTGIIDYDSGSVVLTVGALPDVGSSIIFTWGSGIEATLRSGELDGEAVIIEHDLPHDGIEMGSLSITWAGGSLTDQGDGTLSGNGVGTIAYGEGRIRFTPSVIPASGELFSIAYRQFLAESASITALTVAGTHLQFTIPDAPLLPGSVSLAWDVEMVREVRVDGSIKTGSAHHRAWDDGLGSLRDDTGTAIGTITYSTGAVDVVGMRDYTYKQYAWTTSLGGGQVRTYTRVAGSQGAPELVSVKYQQDDTLAWEAQTDTIDLGALKLDLTPTSVEAVVAGSVLFALGGDTYYDSNGSIYRNRNDATGAGTLAGTINYETGIVTLNTYPQMSGSTVTLHTLVTRDHGSTPAKMTLRLPSAPVRDGSFSLRANLPDGTLLTATATNEGAITASGVSGTIDATFGVVRVNFGELVTAAGNESEDWYHSALVDGDGKIWKPYGILPETGLYNCVVYSYLPLDANLIGIEPIRLPIDGRVPVLRAGDVAVIHHTGDELLPNPVVAGTTYSLSRGSLALCDLRDQDGTLVSDTLYTVDLAAGTVTMADPLDLSAYTQPLVAAHRIEDMVLLAEAQINGNLRTVGHITHNFPATETQVSGALIFGDLAARIVRQFTQKTWSGVWSDSRIGDDVSSADFDSLHYPIVVTNEGAISQRWCILFTGSTTFNVVSENMGVIATGTTNSDVQPINPATEAPYFTIDYRGWGSGWASGNCLRFDTSAANAPVWISRTTMPGPVEEPTDEFVLQIRGDAN